MSAPGPQREFDPNAIQPRTIHFQYLDDVDVVVATPVWTLENEADVHEWYGQYSTYFKENFDAPVDTILDLSFFSVKPGIGSLFGEYRAKVVDSFTRRNYRCHNQDARVKTFMYTSAVKYNATANDFPTFEAAMAELLADRAAAGD